MKFKYYQYMLMTALFNISAISLGIAQKTAPDSALKQQDENKRTVVGYGTQKSSIVTSAVSVVYGSELEKNFNTNLGNTLFGKLPGVTVTQTGVEPGNNNPSILARGVGTFGGAGTSPLIIIDGFDTDQNQVAFNSLTPEEVESITYLKDASATAVYGFRGANGVLLVTTKRGKLAPLKVNFSTRQGFTQAVSLPPLLNSYDYARLYNEALVNDGKTPLYSAADLSSYQTNNDPYYRPNVNWYNAVLRKLAPVSSYNLNFTGGSSSVSYFVSVNALTDGGLYKKFGDQDPQSINSNFNKYNFRSNLDFTFSKNLTAAFSLGGSVTNKTNPGGYNTDATFNAISLLPPNAFPIYNPNGSFGGSSTLANPIANLLKTGSYQTDTRAVQASIRINEKLDMITNGLSVSGGVSLNSYFSGGSAKTRSYARYALSTDASGNPVYTTFGSNTTLAAQEDILDQYHTFEFQAALNYDRIFGRNEVTAMATYDMGNYTINGNNPSFKHSGGAGRLTYINSECYVAEFSLGYTGSENFPPGKRFGYFPAGSIGWVVSKEDFLKNTAVISYLKLRASYGFSGNDRISGTRFAYTQTYPYAASYIFGTGTSTYTPARVEGPLANLDLTWEKVKQTNIGFEATVMKNIDLSFDVFNQDRYNIIVPSTGSIAQIIGVTSVGLNQGKTNNKGLEASLRYNSNALKSIRYFLAANFSYARNKILVNNEAIHQYAYQYTVNNRIDQPFGYQAIGFLTADEANPASTTKVATPVGVPVQAGDLKYKDQNGDGKIDQNDAVAIGNPTYPDITVGLHTGISFKGFDLDVVFQGVKGRSVYLSGPFYQAFQNNGTASEVALGRWTPTSAATATYPRLSTTGNQNNYLFSSFYQQNGDFIKLRSAELGYTLNKSITNRLKIDQTRIFVTGTNLFSLDHVKYGDPETLSGYPVQRTLTLGVKVQF